MTTQTTPGEDRRLERAFQGQMRYSLTQLSLRLRGAAERIDGYSDRLQDESSPLAERRYAHLASEAYREVINLLPNTNIPGLFEAAAQAEQCARSAKR